MPPSVVSAITTNGSFSHSFIWSRCVLSPRKKGSPHAHAGASLLPFLHPCVAWHMDCLPACLMGGYSNKTMHGNGRTPKQKEAEALVSAFVQRSVRSFRPTDRPRPSSSS